MTFLRQSFYCLGLQIFLCSAFCLSAQLVMGPTAKSVATLTADDVTIAYKQGWMECFADNIAIDEFHRRADELNDDESEAELERVWSECKKQADEVEQQWSGLTRGQKLDYRIESFWKSGRGQPRRISKRGRHQLIDKLSPYKGS
jgi:hypothetical protein